MNPLHYFQSPLPSLVLRASSDIVQARIQALAELAGIDMYLAAPTDTAHSGVLLFEEEHGMKVPSIRASFHPSYASYFAEGSIILDVEEEAGDILELMIAAGATSRGTVIGLLGSHGGVGTTTIACTLAHIVSTADATKSIALMDCDPLSTGIGTWCGLNTSGINWADLSEKTGTLVPGRLAKALPRRDNLRVLSADERTGMPTNGELPIRAITALSQSHDMTIMDFPRSIVTGNTDLLSWCDSLILVTDTSPHAVSQSRRTLSFLKNHCPQTPLILAVNRVSGGAQAASIAYDIGFDTIAPVRLARTLTRDLEHGVTLGERYRSGMYKDIAHLSTMFEKVC